MSDKNFTREIYDALVKAVDSLPKEAVERTKAAETRKGYDTTGYQYQYLVNVLNETVTPSGWDFDYETVNVQNGSFANGRSFFEITVSTRVRVLDAYRKCVGGHISTSYADAMKGAITNSLKKTLGLFGVGKAAYEGTIDDDYKPIPDMSEAVVKTSAPKPAPSQEATAPCDNASCRNVAKTRYGRLCWNCNEHRKKGGTIAKLRSEGAVPEEEVPLSEIPF